jgi:hypothetical protein
MKSSVTPVLVILLALPAQASDDGGSCAKLAKLRAAAARTPAVQAGLQGASRLMARLGTAVSQIELRGAYELARHLDWAIRAAVEFELRELVALELQAQLRAGYKLHTFDSVSLFKALQGRASGIELGILQRLVGKLGYADARALAAIAAADLADNALYLHIEPGILREFHRQGGKVMGTEEARRLAGPMAGKLAEAVKRISLRMIQQGSPSFFADLSIRLANALRPGSVVAAGEKRVLQAIVGRCLTGAFGSAVFGVVLDFTAFPAAAVADTLEDAWTADPAQLLEVSEARSCEFLESRHGAEARRRLEKLAAVVEEAEQVCLGTEPGPAVAVRADAPGDEEIPWSVAPEQEPAAASSR